MAGWNVIRRTSIKDPSEQCESVSIGCNKCMVGTRIEYLGIELIAGEWSIMQFSKYKNFQCTYSGNFKSTW